MTDRQTTQLQMRWIPVTDEQGRTHMESVWFDAAAAPVSISHAA